MVYSSIIYSIDWEKLMFTFKFGVNFVTKCDLSLKKKGGLKKSSVGLRTALNRPPEIKNSPRIWRVGSKQKAPPGAEEGCKALNSPALVWRGDFGSFSCRGKI